MKLSHRHCVPCEGGIPPLPLAAAKRYLKRLKRGWQIKDNKLQKVFRFKNFVASMGFANQVALIAQAENHHPDMHIAFAQVEITLWTHAAGGLTENDFVLAAKTDLLQ